MVGFAFTELLGFKLLPRMKNIGAIELYSPDAIQTAWPKVDKILKMRPITGGGALFRPCAIPQSGGTLAVAP
ncbi:Tn3 family transposase [Nonomuraea sp. NPDC049784]|uniref:Tn3 family transposase n=1 Tax=Nonomuraea sp. NPDC049784 TaxID=3154361 RepID=UPI00340EB54A